MEQVCTNIGRMNLFKVRSHTVVVSAKEYLDYAETMREKDMEDLATSTQNALTNALGKLEEVLYDTNTHRCKGMTPVYMLFERKVLEALVNVSSPVNRKSINEC